MANLLRLKKINARVNEREFPFVVQVAVPDAGFECTLDAINAWHCYSKYKQRRGQRQRVGEREYWRWCFEGLEVAKSFRLRFGGQLMPLAVRRVETQRDRVRQPLSADRFGQINPERAVETKQT